MRFLKAVLVLAALCFISGAGAQMFPQWAVRAGGPDLDQGYACVTDASGNTFVTGRFKVDALFGSTSLNSAGGYDVFVAKISPVGQWLWAVRAGGAGDEYGMGIALDGLGNICVCGSFEGTSTFGTQVLTGMGGMYQDIFVAKLSPTGQWLWARDGGSVSVDNCAAVSVDGSGNVRVAGTFMGTASFGSFTLTSMGSSDIVVASLSPDGQWQWALRAGSTTSDSVGDIVCSASGTTYITGPFASGMGVAFGGNSLTGAGSADIYVAAIQNGEWLWAVCGGGVQGDFGSGIALSGNLLYIAGTIKGTASFGTNSVTSMGLDDACVACLDTNGQWQWVSTCGGADNESGDRIAVDYAGRIVLAGRFTSNIVVCANVELINSGYMDVFVARLSPSGTWLDATKGGGTHDDTCRGLGLDASGNAYITGFFYWDCAFGDVNLTSDGDIDLFVAKISCEAVPNDLAALAISGNTNPLQNEPNSYLVRVKNKGTNAQPTYSVLLRDQADYVLATVPGPLLAAGEETDVELVWTPLVAVNYTLRGQVMLAGDQWVPNDLTPPLEVSVVQLGSIAGMVRKPNNAPIGGATVTCSNASVTESVITGTNGTYTLHLLPGEYSATASCPGYDPVTYTAVQIQSGITTTLHFTLHSSDADDPAVPDIAFRLHGCDPDPFRDVARITYSLPIAQSITLSIHDIRGRRVATLWDGMRPSGAGYVVWDGRDARGRQLPNGIYLCRMAGGGRISTLKLVLLK
jgi:hypothetical protein